MIFGLILSGDDCVSIQTGCSNVYIHNVNCGPGHGISIGSLGKDHTKACVSNITVRDVTMHNTMNGVRIKTWQVLVFTKKNMCFILCEYGPLSACYEFKSKFLVGTIVNRCCPPDTHRLKLNTFKKFTMNGILSWTVTRPYESSTMLIAKH